MRGLMLIQDNKGRVSYLRILQWLLVMIIFFLLGRTVWQDWAQVRGASFSVRPFLFVSGTVVFAFSYFIQIGAWYLITLKLGIALSFSETVENWFTSQLGKYLPGKVWLVLGRFYFYESKGKSKKMITIALYLETVILIVTGALIFFASLLFLKELRFIQETALGWTFLLLALVLLSLHPWVLRRICNWILTRFKREPISLPISYPNILWILLTCLLSWVVGGIGFYFLIHAIYPIGFQHVLFLTGSLAISSTLGLIALFAPGGLGVREGALAYLLSFLVPGSVAVILSVLTRIWMTLIEIGLIGMIYLFGLFRKRAKEGSFNAPA
jgi:uncharacterized membrane protein YbhN (UPF0104 family)